MVSALQLRQTRRQPLRIHASRGIVRKAAQQHFTSGMPLISFTLFSDPFTPFGSYNAENDQRFVRNLMAMAR
eukprot:14695438-Heterocapsa_arctica.AAC.1